MNKNEGSPTTPETELEHQRVKDLMTQVESFLKFAVKGTAPEVLVREVSEFDRRLASFMADSHYSKKIRSLRKKLKEIA